MTAYGSISISIGVRKLDADSRYPRAKARNISMLKRTLSVSGSSSAAVQAAHLEHVVARVRAAEHLHRLKAAVGQGERVGRRAPFCRMLHPRPLPGRIYGRFFPSIPRGGRRENRALRKRGRAAHGGGGPARRRSGGGGGFNSVAVILVTSNS